MGYGLLNLGSLLLGLTAWILPIINLAMGSRTKHKKVLSGTSVTACAMALCLQIIYQNHLVKIEDWSALMDTSHAVTFVSVILLVGTIALNAITAFSYQKGTII
jgi:cytochrome c oxidase subunit 4